MSINAKLNCTKKKYFVLVDFTPYNSNFSRNAGGEGGGGTFFQLKVKIFSIEFKILPHAQFENKHFTIFGSVTSL